MFELEREKIISTYSRFDCGLIGTPRGIWVIHDMSQRFFQILPKTSFNLTQFGSRV